jgi:hypothetical protein
MLAAPTNKQQRGHRTAPIQITLFLEAVQRKKVVRHCKKIFENWNFLETSCIK